MNEAAHNVTGQTVSSSEFFLRMRDKVVSGYAGSLALTSLYSAGILVLKDGEYGREYANWQKVNPDNVTIDFAKLRSMVADGTLRKRRCIGRKNHFLILKHSGIHFSPDKKAKTPVPRCECCGQRLPLEMRKHVQ